MNGLISRADLFNSLSDKWDKAELYMAIQAAPEVEAEPVHRGKWCLLNMGFVVCDYCYDSFVDAETLNKGKWNFCPVCGADMRGKI